MAKKQKSGKLVPLTLALDLPETIIGDEGTTLFMLIENDDCGFFEDIHFVRANSEIEMVKKFDVEKWNNLGAEDGDWKSISDEDAEEERESYDEFYRIYEMGTFN